MKRKSKKVTEPITPIQMSSGIISKPELERMQQSLVIYKYEGELLEKHGPFVPYPKGRQGAAYRFSKKGGGVA